MPVEEVEDVDEATKEVDGKDDDDEDEEDEDENDEEEDDDDEPEDPMVTLRNECLETEAAKPFSHHFHECIERVTKEQEEEGYAEKHYKEDCVEEFFHLQHVINDCVSPRLFHRLQ